MKNPETVRAAGVDRNSLEHFNLPNRPDIIKKDARILQFLKRECKRHGTGEATLNKVFTGLLSVHNRHLPAFADALKREADHGNNR